jgi:NAD(P)-dependent dehydrogenase (short-subunit alcohol dehydrogenase family)
MAGLVEGKVAVITGGASGLGRGIAIRLAEEGAAAIVVADMREDAREGGDPTTTVVQAAGAKSVFVPTDVRKIDDLRRAVAAADQFGGVDIMVNNAGVAMQEDFFAMTEEDYDRVMDINVKGVYFGAQAAALSMRAQGKTGGVIINMSSVGGVRGGKSLIAYCSSKGAVRLMTYGLADLLGPDGIRVNAIHPGLMDTAMNRADLGYVDSEGKGVVGDIPLTRTGQPSDIGDAAVFLSSDLASYVSGTSLVVDGGRLRVM